jgi:serine/threonine protein kinase
MTATILNQRYQLDKELGRGSMGVVYHARDQLLERDVLVKVLNQARLDTDGRCAGYLAHPSEFLGNGDAKSLKIGYHAGQS